MTSGREVNVRELKARATAILRCVEAGECVTVTRRGQAVAILQPIHAASGTQRPGTAESIYQALQRQIGARVPGLLRATPTQAAREFDRISRKIKRVLPYPSWRDMDRAVKGDRLGLSRQ